MVRRTPTLALLLVALTPATALACGGMVSEEGAAEIQGFEALLHHTDGEQRLLLTIDYGGGFDGSELGWMMPFPSAPEIDPGDDQPIGAALRITDPPEKDDIVPPLIPEGEDDETAAGGGAPGAEVFGRETVAGLRFVTLGGTVAGDVREWMDEHGFAFHDRQEVAVQGYLDRGWVIVAAKVPRGAPPDAALQPIEFRFAARKPVYPLAFAGTEHKGFLSMTLFVLSEERLRSTTYREEVVTPEDGLRSHFVRKHLELRYAAPLSVEDAVAMGAEPGTWLSRYEAHWRTDRLDEDLVLAPSSNQDPIDFRAVLDEWESERTWIYVQRVAYPILLLIVVVVVSRVLLRLARRARTA